MAEGKPSHQSLYKSMFQTDVSSTQPVAIHTDDEARQRVEGKQPWLFRPACSEPDDARAHLCQGCNGNGLRCNRPRSFSVIGTNACLRKRSRDPATLAYNCPPIFRRFRWNKQSTTDDKNHEIGHFRITHPFHPKTGQEFRIVQWRHNWNETLVYFTDGRNRLQSVPEAWTDLLADDPLIIIAKERAHFRVPDLLELAILLKELMS